MPWGLLQLLAVGFVLALGIGVWLVVRRLRRPPRKTYAWALSKGAPGDPGELPTPRAFEDLMVNLGGRAFPVWSIVGDAARGPVVIFTPGWGDSRLGVLPRLRALAPWASRIVAWDPPGQGEAPGRCDLGVREGGLLSALIDESKRWDASAVDAPIVLFGSSLGAGLSIVAAAARAGDDDPRIVGVVAEAPYREAWTPAFNVLHLSGIPYQLNAPIAFALLGLRFGIGPTWRGFDRASHAARLACPLLVIHGDDDEICPPEDGRAIAEAAGEGELIEVEGAAHNNLWTEEPFAEVCSAAIGSFLARCAPAASGEEIGSSVGEAGA